MKGSVNERSNSLISPQQHKWMAEEGKKTECINRTETCKERRRGTEADEIHAALQLIWLLLSLKRSLIKE